MPGPYPSATTDFRDRMSYGDYLPLDDLLAPQRPLSVQHDGMLFIAIHHEQELWLKLLLHGLELAIGCIWRDELRPAFKALARYGRIQKQLIEAWHVLATMTPQNYLAFRSHLGSCSGIQSWQYRMLKFRLGAKNAFMLKPHEHRQDLLAPLQAALQAPSLYDETVRLLVRRGIALPPEVLKRDLTQPHTLNKAVTAAWAAIYENAEQGFDLYELAELEDAFQTWRFRHMRTVERIIGYRMGTGSSAGVAYLKGVIDKRFFPELYEARTRIRG